MNKLLLLLYDLYTEDVNKNIAKELNWFTKVQAGIVLQ